MRTLVLIALALTVLCAAPSWGVSKAIIDLGNPDYGTNLTHVQVGDGDTTPATVGGLVCRRNVNPNDDYYFYFRVSDSWAYQASKPEVYVSIHYYDSGTGSMSLQYDGKSGAYTGAGSFSLTNTNTWKIYTWHVKDAYFGNRQNNSSDFRIGGPIGSTFYLDFAYVRQFSQKVPSLRVHPRPGPNDNGQPFADMMNYPNEWPATRLMMNTLGYYDHTLNNRSDAELDAWMYQIPTWGCLFGLEVGAVKDWGPTGEQCFEAEHGMWDRFIAHGATIDQLCMDEPLWCVRDNNLGDDYYAVNETVDFMSLVRDNYEGVQIVSIEPHPAISISSLQWWINALNDRCAAVGTEGIDAFCADVDWVRFPRDGNWSGVKSLEDFCRSKNLPFSLIYMASAHPNSTYDPDWYNDIMSQGNAYKNVGGKPDEYNVESWMPYIPSQAVPEWTSYTFTNSARDFRQNFVTDNAQYVSDTIPSSMTPGQQVNVSVTMKNTGVTTWNLIDRYKLGGVGDSDPFASARQNLSTGDFVEPNQNKTFNFTMTAPTTPGTYTSDWQMVHEYLQWFGGTLVKVIEVGSGQTPYAGVIPIPGTAQAENFDNGGEGVAYHDTSSGNYGGAYRSTDVDIEATGDTGGGYNVGWIDGGEWLEYTVNVASAGNYDIKARVASPGTGGALRVEMNGQNVSGTMSVPNTGDWQNYTTVTASNKSLNAGQQIMRVYMESAPFNLNYIQISSAVTTVSIDLGTTNAENGMTCPSAGDGHNYAVDMGGVNCRRNTDPNEDYYFYFCISDSWAYQGSKPDVYIRVRYYDTGGGNIAVQYDSPSDPYKMTSAVTVGSTNTWKYATWHITDAYFGNRQNNGADFRLWLNTGKIRYIDTVEVSVNPF